VRSWSRLLVLGCAAIQCVCWLAAPAAWAIERNDPAAAVQLDCNALSATIVTLPDSAATVAIQTSGAGIVHIDERGQEVSAASTDGALIEVSTPPRFGQMLAEVQRGSVVSLRRARPGAAQGTVLLRLNCAPDAAARARLLWVTRVAQIESAITGPLDAQTLDFVEAKIRAVAVDAAAGHDSALAAHLLAQTYLVAGRSSDASTAFEVAQQAWLALGDRDRAMAALVARAEDLQRTAAYESVLQTTRSLDGLPGREHYFSVRLENSRCLALHYLARLGESSACYQWTIARLDELDESLKLISTLQDYAQLERDRGDLTRAAELANQSLAMIASPMWDALPGPDVPMVRGRVYRLLGDLAVRRGDIAEGLRQAQLALELFTKANNPRWQGNTMLRIAAIYRELDAHEDAYEAVTAAFGRFSRKDAPARIATAFSTLAEINLADGRADQAQRWARQAASEFTTLHMDVDAVLSKFIAAEAAIGLGDFELARSIVESVRPVPPGLAPRAALIEGEIAAKGNQWPQGGQWYQELARVPRPLTEWMRAQTVAAQNLQRSGDAIGAQQMLESAVDHMTELAGHTTNPVLRLALERKRRVLRSVALRINSERDGAQPSAALVWRWVVRADTALPASVVNVQRSSSSEFDRALAQSMLPPTRINGDKARFVDAGLERRLLDVVAADAADRLGITPLADESSLARIQQSLPVDTTLLVLLDGGPTTLMLAVTREGTVVARSALESNALRNILARLKVAIDNGSGSVPDIQADAALLSNALLGPLTRTAPPAHLLVYAQEPFNGVPWSLLQWPGSATALIESTAISLVVLRQSDFPMPAMTSPGTIHIVAADVHKNATTGLPALAGAVIEPSMVLRGVRGVDRATSIVGNPTRHAVLEALADSGAWVHIAAHGSHQAGYIGRSGIWLSSTGPNQMPEILSWIEVLDRGVRADLVVLNACAMAASSKSSISASVGFAEAVVRAGADNVVAALWPVSDTASSQWVTEFYQQLGTSQPTSFEIANAVRQAARRLRASRMFRHPSHWASLVHLTNLTFAGSVAETAHPSDQQAAVR